MSASADDWRHLAACAEADVETFFPVGNSKEALEADDAKAYCRRCPVIDFCREYALRNHVDQGVFGGLTETERRRIHRRKHASSHIGRSA